MSIGYDDVSKNTSASSAELPKATRRRGEALEKSLLDAAWQVLARSGFGGFTMDAVAIQAGTSRPVLYRRWSSVSELAMDAIRHRAIENSVEPPDTGNLRDDLVTFLDELGKRREEILVLFSVGAAQVFGDARGSFAEIFEKIRQPERGLARIHAILDRAASRGEIDAAPPTPRVSTLPLDLLRHEVLTTLKPVPRAVLEEIIDDVFLPLVRATTAKASKRPPSL
jgi:AcrR family transcriptional regulator